MTKAQKTLVWVLLCTSSIGFFGSLIDNGLSTFLYFTHQSNLMVWITSILVIKGNQKYLPWLSMITLVSILMTGIIFNTLLIEYEASMAPRHLFYSKLNHTVNPLMYTVIFFWVLETRIQLKTFYYLLVHPFVYFMAYVVTGPFTKFYPYPFMNPITLGTKAFIITNLLVLLPILVIFSIGLIALKEYVTRHQENKQTS
jgi:hypothetical protein